MFGSKELVCVCTCMCQCVRTCMCHCVCTCMCQCVCTCMCHCVCTSMCQCAHVPDLLVCVMDLRQVMLSHAHIMELDCGHTHTWDTRGWGFLEFDRNKPCKGSMGVSANNGITYYFCRVYIITRFTNTGYPCQVEMHTLCNNVILERNPVLLKLATRK